MVVQLVNIVVVWVFFIESYGLEKSQIYKKLRGIEFKGKSKDQEINGDGKTGGGKFVKKVADRGGLGTERKILVQNRPQVQE